MAVRISRRIALALLAGTGAALAAATCLWENGPEALIARILERRFPGVKIGAASIAALTRDIKAARFQSFGRRLALESGARIAGLVGLDVFDRLSLTATQFAQLERKIVTFFVLGSNF